VVKADGLAAGKGVVVAATVDEAVAAVRGMLSGDAFGAAGRRVVVEEFLAGEEAQAAFSRANYEYPVNPAVEPAEILREWGEFRADTVRRLASLPQREARLAADALRAELEKFAPRLMRHSGAEASCEEQGRQELEASLRLGRERLSAAPLTDEVWVSVERATPPFLPEPQPAEEALRHRANRYGCCGLAIRRMRVAFAWNNLAVAELRDLNRHRTGHRYAPCVQAGFYLPPEIGRDPWRGLLERQTALLGKLLERGDPAYVYALLLGSQTPFEHSTHADKFVYEAELRTGLGAHFRYAEHLGAALAKFCEAVPEAKEWVREGTAEPE